MRLVLLDCTQTRSDLNIYDEEPWDTGLIFSELEPLISICSVEISGSREIDNLETRVKCKISSTLGSPDIYAKEKNSGICR